jgi:hypothetical protein
VGEGARFRGNAARRSLDPVRARPQTDRYGARVFGIGSRLQGLLVGFSGGRLVSADW